MSNFLQNTWVSGYVKRSLIYATVLFMERGGVCFKGYYNKRSKLAETKRSFGQGFPNAKSELEKHSVGMAYHSRKLLLVRLVH